MKHRIIYLFLSFSLMACSGPKEPVCERVENIRPVKKGKLEYTLSADIVMSNPNSIGAKLMKTDLDIYVNDVKIGKANQRIFTEVGANEEFKIPVKCTFGLKDILKDQNNSLGGLLNAFAEKKVDLRYEGSVTLKLAGIEFDVPVDYEQEVSLKK